MTYPLIGNYGITAGDNESLRPRLSGFVARAVQDPSNYESIQPVGDFLKSTASSPSRRSTRAR